MTLPVPELKCEEGPLLPTRVLPGGCLDASGMMSDQDSAFFDTPIGREHT